MIKKIYPVLILNRKDINGSAKTKMNQLHKNRVSAYLSMGSIFI